MWPLDRKVIGLLYDFLSIAENTKLQSTKVQKALQVLYTNKVLTVSVPKNSKLEDVLDKMDTAVRILLAMLPLFLMKLKQRACQGQAGCHWH